MKLKLTSITQKNMSNINQIITNGYFVIVVLIIETRFDTARIFSSPQTWPGGASSTLKNQQILVHPISNLFKSFLS